MTDLTDTQKVFLLSRLYGAPYDGDKYQPRPWVWPTQTWLQLRLAEKAQEVKGD